MNKELLNSFYSLAKINKIDLHFKAEFLEDLPDPILENMLRNLNYEQLFNLKSVITSNRKLKEKFDDPYFKNLLKQLMKEKESSHKNRFGPGGRVGLWKNRFVTGEKSSEGMYGKTGKEEGDWYYYYPEGTLSVQGSFKEGSKHGVWKIYNRGEGDTQGSVRRIAVYKNGRLIEGEDIKLYKGEFLEDMSDIMLKNFLSNKSFSSFDIINLKQTSKKMRKKLEGEYYDDLIKQKIDYEITEILNFINKTEENEELKFSREELLNEQRLSITSNNDIPVGIGHLTNLRELTIYGKNKTIPDSISKLKYLLSLVITNNKLEYLPESIGKLNLSILDVSDNRLKELPESIGDMTSLYQLKFYNNRISKLPKNIGNLRFLQILDFHNNLIKEFPDSMLQLPKLKEFVYEDNCYGKALDPTKTIGFYQLTETTQKVLKKQHREVEYSFSRGYVKKNYKCDHKIYN